MKDAELYILHVDGIKDEIDDIGPALDFLWLHTCYSWGFEDRVSPLGAADIVFFGADGDSRSSGQTAFYYAITRGEPVEETIDDICQANNPNYKMKDLYDGNLHIYTG